LGGGQRIADSKNFLAISVKIADIEDNKDPLRLQYLDSKTQERMGKKYKEAEKILRELK
jgi:hypothetical protein